jgi:AcrR family transcriptional regulator
LTLGDRKEYCEENRLSTQSNKLVLAMSKKQIILQAAAKLFSERGFKETPMSELSKLTGVAEGTIFYHFKNKEELFVAILEDLRKTITEEFERYALEKEFHSGLQMVEGALLFYLELASHLEDRFLLLHRHYPYELAEANRECRKHLEAIYNCFVDIFERAVVRGQEDGSIAKMPPRKAAMLLFSMVDGLVRFDTYNLYDAGALYQELIESCRRMLKNTKCEDA